MLDFIRKNQISISIFCLVIILLPYLYLSYYSNPIADDFCYAFKAKTGELLPSLLSEYLHWNGRYISNILVYVNPVGYNLYSVYKMLPAFFILISVFAYFIFVKTIISTQLKKAETFLISLILSSLFIYQLPTVSQGIYWYTGVVTYQAANILTLFYLSALYLFCQGKFLLRSKIFHLFLITLLLFLIIGFNEVTMLALLCFAIISFIIAYRKQGANKNLFTYLLILTILLSAIVIFAPGNYTRESVFPEKHQVIRSLIYSLAQTLRFSFDWISSAPLLLLSIFYFYLNKTLSKNITLFSESFYLNPFVSLFLLFFSIFICISPCYWSTGLLGQHRTINVAYFLFILLWFINLTVWFNQYKEATFQLFPEKIKFALAIITWCCFVFTKNGYDALEDIVYEKAEAYNKQMNERYRIIESAITSGSDTIYFEGIKNPPKSLFVLDINEDPDHWINTSYLLYFDLDNKKILKK